MRKEIINLIEAVRRLDIRIVDGPPPACVRLGGKVQQVPERLMELQLALDALDRAGGIATDVEIDAAEQAARFKTALDGVFRWLRMQGIDVSEPTEIVGDALQIPKSKRKKSYTPLPVFAPTGWKKKSGYKPKLNIIPAYGARGSMSDIRSHAFDLASAQTMMGSAAVRTVANTPEETDDLRLPVQPGSPGSN